MTQENAPILSAGTPWPSQHHAPLPRPLPRPGVHMASSLRSTGLGQDVHQYVHMLILLTHLRCFAELPCATHSGWRDESKQNLAFKKLKVSQRARNPLSRGSTDNDQERPSFRRPFTGRLWYKELPVCSLGALPQPCHVRFCASRG